MPNQKPERTAQVILIYGPETVLESVEKLLRVEPGQLRGAVAGQNRSVDIAFSIVDNGERLWLISGA